MKIILKHLIIIYAKKSIDILAKFQIFSRWLFENKPLKEMEIKMSNIVPERNIHLASVVVHTLENKTFLG